MAAGRVGAAPQGAEAAGHGQEWDLPVLALSGCCVGLGGPLRGRTRGGDVGVAAVVGRCACEQQTEGGGGGWGDTDGPTALPGGWGWGWGGWCLCTGRRETVPRTPGNHSLVTVCWVKSEQP